MKPKAIVSAVRRPKTWCRALTLTLFALLFLPWDSYPSPGVHRKATTKYLVTTRGFRIGSVTTTQSVIREGADTIVRFETRTSVKAAVLWMGYHQDTVEGGVIRNGALQSYSRHGVENGGTVAVEGRLEGAVFKFKISGKSGDRTIEIPRAAYDGTTMECPEARLDFSRSATVPLRVLDVEHFSVVRREYRFVEESRFTVSGIEYPCRIVEFSDQNKRARRWIYQDGGGVIMFRQDGDNYSVTASSLIRQPGEAAAPSFLLRVPLQVSHEGFVARLI